VREPGTIRRIVALTASVLLIGAVTVSSGAARETAQAPEIPDHLRAFSVIPPGQSGGPINPHSLDQLGMYSSLIDDDDVGEEELSTYFHAFQFGPGTIIESTVTPRSGVTVYRDTFGIPHIYADSDDSAAFGTGYATAEDRLWHADILRRAARGRLSEILGRDFLASDKEMRRDTYSANELRMMFADLAKGSPSEEKLHDMLQAYSDGINAYIGEIEAGTSPRPAEYVARQVTIEPWDPIDTVALAAFQLRQFGESSGAELRNAALYQELRRKLGKKLGTRVFRDLTAPNDPNAYPTVPESEGSFDSQNLGRVERNAVAIPDRARKAWRKTTAGLRAMQSQSIPFEMPASNFLTVGPSKSATGNSLQFGAPQVGYSVPQFFMEVDVHSPGFDFRGPALPGASLLVPIGRGIDYAWSLTTAVADSVDTRIERLCNPNGKVTKSSNHYLFKGKCRRMSSRTEQIRTGQGNDATETRLKVFRTVHGPVLQWATVGGRPVALVRERTFWKKEIETVVALLAMASNETDNIEEFLDAAAQFNAGFNIVYADAESIAYVHAGAYPVRAAGVDPMLPTWGTGKWEWKGRLPFAQQPQVVNPAQGWLVNWNNKPAAGWDNGDAARWGPTHRVRLLAEAMEDLLSDDNKATLSDVVDVAREAATRDAQAVYLWESLSDFLSTAGGTSGTARDQLDAWIAEGAHRWDRDRDGRQDFGPAVAVWDTFYNKLVHRIFDDELGGLYSLVNVPVSDGAANSNGSAYFADFSMHLWNLFNDGDLARDYCDNRKSEAKETCAEVAVEALQATVDDLSSSQGSAVSLWTWPADYIEFGAVGAVMAPPIPWQNRGTYNHAVEVTGSR
jgi:acyl-homoserine lactone acylase PvdQ